MSGVAHAVQAFVSPPFQLRAPPSCTSAPRHAAPRVPSATESRPGGSIHVLPGFVFAVLGVAADSGAGRARRQRSRGGMDFTWSMLRMCGRPAPPLRADEMAQHRRQGSYTELRLGAPADVLRRAAKGRNGGATRDEIMKALEELQASPYPAAPVALVEGRYVLVFSSAIIDVPFVEGFMPNREVLNFDFSGSQQMQLEIETVPFLPSMQVIGENCSYNEPNATVSYCIRGNAKASHWHILFADDEILVGESSVTGLNICRRLPPAAT